jgi:protein SCO1
MKVVTTLFTLFFSLSCLLASGALMAQTGRTSKTTTTQAKTVYACPMHPDVTSSKRGRCPKCGMDLRRTTVTETPATSTTAAPPVERKTETYSFNSSKIPHARVLDQNGKQLNFYDDLIKGKSVAINFVFTTCTAICPSLTATFRRVQQEAKTRGVDVQLISISVDPGVDTPERLNDFAKKFKAEPGWTFVTGDKSEIDSVLQALGVGVSNKNDHTPMVLIGNDVADHWTRTYGLSSPATIVNLIEASAKK